MSADRLVCTCRACICQEHNVSLVRGHKPIIAVVAVFFKVVSNIGLDASSCFSIRRKFSATIEKFPSDELSAFARKPSVFGTKLTEAYHVLLRILERHVCHFPHAISRSSSIAFD